jgi:hypothetical protein
VTPTIIKHIYNTHHKLIEDKYVYSYRVLLGTETVNDIYWAHMTKGLDFMGEKR